MLRFLIESLHTYIKVCTLNFFILKIDINMLDVTKNIFSIQISVNENIFLFYIYATR